MHLPELIACLNGMSFVLLIAALIAVKSRKIRLHKTCMLLAVASSTLFLAVYLLHHYQVGNIPYPRHDWTRTVYFLILVPHIILAVGMLPFIFMALRYAFKNQITQHKKFVQFVYPVWLYVSFTGLVVYYMLYQLKFD